MTWRVPLDVVLVPVGHDTREAPEAGTTWLPLAPHPGAFGVRRAHHTHEGVDLYAAEGAPVRPVEDGTVVVIEPFTGAHAGSPWWRDTWAVYVEGASGVVVYGELIPDPTLEVGMAVTSARVVGHVTRVLREDKGRPTTMLHLELHAPGTRQSPAWDTARPPTLRDPTARLLAAAAVQRMERGRGAETGAASGPASSSSSADGATL